ncbi:efflux transporter periplasmic adaptor subunit [Xaviernesmea oryzae]|uniref:Efflux transporter periplasmic adaptor subunit n=1 Tax=Xaviernesmea oryzae TaxID=464029 RepID=A0A1Q9B318_9HYPH|nr:efflux RND transporter periplasmic adaptor subunit [Xaviernesmea oryzae]OLP62399.1 efflux transporter periplasmic adaptor subunit [Xaviernesmea oryzae]
MIDHRKSIWLPAPLLLGLLFAGTAAAEDVPAQAASAAPRLPAIVVTAVESKPVVDRVKATGTIQAVDESYAAPLVEGLPIAAVNVDVGDQVKAGQVLAALDKDTLLLQKSQYQAQRAKAEAALAQYQAQLVEAQANAEEADRTSARSQRLAASGSVSTAQREQQESAAAAARARVNSAEQMIAVAKADIAVVDAQISDVDLRLTRTDVKAPVSGVISVKTAKVGAIATGAGQPLFTIVRDGALELRADVAETDLMRLAPGQKVAVALADGNETLEGTIRLLSPTVDAQTRLGLAYVSLPSSGKARVGMYAGATITVAEKTALTLPQTAVTRKADGSFARKVEGGVVAMVPVVIGIQDGGRVEVKSGLKAGDQVVAKAGAYVRDGDKINPVTSAPAETN